MSAAAVFDRVVVVEPSGRRVLSREEFIALPIHLRVRYILERQVEFFLGSAPVDRGVALQGLRSLTAQLPK